MQQMVDLLSKQFTKKRIHATVLLSAVFFVLLPIVAMAQVETGSGSPITLEVGLGNTYQVDDLIDYVATAYKFIVSVSGILAAAMIMINGLKWVMAAGNAQIISTAKEGVVSAITGLVIAMTSFMLLWIINPKLVNFSELKVPELSFKQNCGTDVGGTLVNFEKEISEARPDLKKYYKYVGSEEPCMSEELLPVFVKALEFLANHQDNYQDVRFTVTSVYRTKEKQEKLYQCYLDRNPNGSCSAGCSSCSEANPWKEPPTSHLAGNAIDIGWTGRFDPDLSADTIVPNHQLMNTPWHELCMVNKQYGSSVKASDGVTDLECTVDAYNSVYKLNWVMEQAGIKHIASEWWHHQPGATYGPGSYK